MRLAIIGASSGQLPLCVKAKEMGLETLCFAWPKGAVCKDIVDYFIPISIMEMEKIVEICKDYGVDGVVSNASEITAQVTAYVSERLGLNGLPYQVLLNIQDKNWVREKTKLVKGLSKIKYKRITAYELQNEFSFPFIVKPTHGSAKKGVYFIETEDQLNGLKISKDLQDNDFLIEQFISGHEVSVESISFHGKHQVLQITDKLSTGAPHFAELGHLQPSNLNKTTQDIIRQIVPCILETIGFTNGASHIELKIDESDNIYLIEVNPRGGGDMISNEMVTLSTDCDYIKAMIDVALNQYSFKATHNTSYVGVYFLCKQTEHLLKYFHNKSLYPFIISAEYDGKTLINSTSNYERNGYILISDDNRIEL